MLALFLAGLSFATFFVAGYVFGVDDGMLATIMYLQVASALCLGHTHTHTHTQMSSAPHFVIFSTRLAEPFYTNRPSIWFIIAVLSTQVFAMFISVYGWLSDPMCVLVVVVVSDCVLCVSGWFWGAAIMAISLVYSPPFLHVFTCAFAGSSCCWTSSKCSFTACGRSSSLLRSGQHPHVRSCSLLAASHRHTGRAKLAQIQQHEAKLQRVQAFAKKLRVCTAALVFANRVVRASAARHPAANLSLSASTTHDEHEHAAADSKQPARECPVMARDPVRQLLI